MHLPKQHQNYHGHHNQHHGAQQHGAQMGHQHNLSAGAFQGATPHLGAAYGQEHLQNGNRDGAQHDDLEDGSEYWQEQRRLYLEAETMNEGHHRARTVAQQTKGLTFSGALGNAGDDVSVEDKTRNLTLPPTNSRQAWTELDLGGQGLRALSPNLYKYAFLTRLDIPHNLLRNLPSAIGQLKSLEYLDVSFNQLESLPDEIGVLMNLKTLLFSGNYISVLPNSLGYLHKLELIGCMPASSIELEKDQKVQMAEGGTKALTHYLLNTMERKYLKLTAYRETLTHDSSKSA